jgi:hypothetical protein
LERTDNQRDDGKELCERAAGEMWGEKMYKRDDKWMGDDS